MKNYYRIYGDPVPWTAPKTASRMRRDGRRYIAHISPSKYVRWKNHIIGVVRSSFDYSGPMKGPVCLTLTFFLKKAKSCKLELPCKVPDLSNLVKGVEDAIKKGLIFMDDCQVIEGSTAKYFADEKNPPGVVIKISEWKGEKENGE